MSVSILDICSDFFKERGQDINKNTVLIPSDIFDSVGLLELVMLLEEKLGHEIDQGMVTAENFASVTALEEALRNKGYLS